jgi:hypothetical protein
MKFKEELKKFLNSLINSKASFKSIKVSIFIKGFLFKITNSNIIITLRLVISKLAEFNTKVKEINILFYKDNSLI